MEASDHQPGGVESTINDAVEVDADTAKELLANAGGRMFMKLLNRVRDLKPGDIHKFTIQLEYRAGPDRIVSTGEHGGFEKSAMLIKRKGD
jgi:hypothetical protein